MPLPVWASHLDDIKRLQRAWQIEFEKRAGGGAVALSGFHYQFLITLHDTLRAWTDRPAFERSRPKVLTECLSDILDKSSNDIILVTQVKRTNRSVSFQDALTELWLIYDLALKTTPNLVPYLHFRILSKHAELKDFQRALDKWYPSEHQPVSLDLEVFRQSVTVQLFSDPEDEVLAILANELHATEPTAYVQRWLGSLLSAASKEGMSGFEDAAQSIWNDLQSIENSSLAAPPGIYVWTSQDKAPENIVEGKVLTGERPQIHHLREGFFAPRPAVFDPIAAQAQEWSTDLTGNQDNQLRLPIFWIGGRSGSGKSITLMHVLALLYESGVGAVLWLGNKTELLRQAIPWALKLKTNDRQVIIGIDDPYAPNTQSNDIIWKEALAVLEGVRQSGDASALPLIVCCGPSEQAERMQRDLPEEVNVRLTELPQEDRKDISQLRSWYVQRTKKSPPNIGDENILLVQLFFQWETGQDLTQFASRFRRRIKESDQQGRLEDLITCMLCVNRLYVGYPTIAVGKRLTPDLEDTFRRLREQHHITQGTRDYGGGLWLAHAHLANLIYESWYPLYSNRAVRTDHLRRVIADCFEFGVSPGEKMAPLWAISNAILGSPEQSPLVGRLDQETITNLLPSIYKSRIENSGERLALRELPVWIQLRAFSSEVMLTPDPVAEALRRVNVENLDEKGLRLTCHKLLQHYKSFSEDQQSEVIKSIIRLLSQAPHWHEWAPVADDAYRRTRDPRFVKLIVDWVNDHPQSKWAGRLFFFLFKDNPMDPQMISAANDLLPRVGGELHWGDAALRLMEASKSEIPVSVLEWAANNCRQWGACFVLGRLLARGRRLARGWAFEWCARWHTERIANYVLEPLLILLGPNEKLKEWCMRWIAIEHQYVDTGYIVEKLIKTFPSDPEVLSMVLRWLENNGLEHGSWQYIWRALRKAHPYESLTVTKRQANLPLSVFSSTSDQVGQGETELSVSQKLAELMPDDPKSWYYLAIGLGKAQRYDEEITALLKATELNPQFVEAWQALGSTFGRLGHNGPALTATLKLTELTPDDPYAWYYLSIAHSRDGHSEDQIAALIKATKLDPHFAKAWWALRNTYARLGQSELALEAELRLGGLKSDDPESWYDLAIASGRDKRYQAQVSALEKATELNPDFAEAWRTLGALHNQLGEAGRALAAAVRLTELRPNDPQAWYYLSVAHGKLDRYEDQIAALRTATQLDPQFGDAWQSLGAVYNLLGRAELALAANLRLTEIKPDDPEAWQKLGATYNQLGQTESALGANLRLTELRPDDAQAWYYLAIAYSKADHHEKRIAALTKAIELDPQFADAWQSLGALYNQLGETKLALEATLKFTKLRPSDPQAWYYLAIAYSKAGKREDELAALVKATGIDSRCVEAWQSLGAIYFRRRQYALGIEAQTAVVALKPDDILAQKKLTYMLTTAYAFEHPDFEPEDLSTDEAKKFYSIGKSFVATGELDEALDAFNNAIKASPDETKARSSLLQSLIHEATAVFESYSFERAIILLKIAVTLDQNNPGAWNLLSSSYRRAGRNEEALVAAKYLSDITPTDALAWYKLGKRHATLGQLHDAEQAFKQALQLNEDLKAARRELNKLLGKN